LIGQEEEEEAAKERWPMLLVAKIKAEERGQ